MDERLLSHPVLQEELHNPKNGDSAHKHLRQQVSFHRVLNGGHVTIFLMGNQKTFLPKHHQTSLFVGSCVSIKQVLIQVVF